MRGYWPDMSNEGHFFDPYLAKELVYLFYDTTVIDFGCGQGKYVACFNNNNIPTRGYDGNPNTPNWNPDCQVLDLSEIVSLDPADWVLTLEVGEHIPAEFEANFIDNLKRHNKKGIVLSWAVEGQAGRGHFNCRNNDYIKAKFPEYQNDLALEHKLREVATLPWFKNTIMVFRNVPA